jgi:putative ABC transport system permease protein
MAVGATPAQVARRVTAEGTRLVLGGAVAGLIAATLLRNLLSGLLFGISAFDPWTYGAAALMLFFIAVVACAAPLLRASKVDPATALRS